MKYVASLSGGIDSAVALYSAIEKGLEVVGAVFVRYGQPTVDKEHRCVIELLPKPVPLHVISCTLHPVELLNAPAENDPIPTSYVPHRNLILTAMTANMAAQIGATGIVVGWHKQDAAYPDCTMEFLRAMESVLNVGAVNGRLVWDVYAPLMSRTKAEIIRSGVALGVPLHSTWSCYRSNTVPCGVCAGCLEREQGFREAEVSDFNSRERTLRRKVGTMRD